LRALDLDPNSVFARGYLGVNYAFGGDYDAALPHLDEAIRLSPRDPLLIIWHLCKGWAALLTQRYEEAIEFAGIAAEANRNLPTSTQYQLPRTGNWRAWMPRRLHWINYRGACPP